MEADIVYVNPPYWCVMSSNDTARMDSVTVYIKYFF